MDFRFTDKTKFWLILISATFFLGLGLLWLIDDWLSIHALSERQDHPNSNPVWLVTSTGWSILFEVWPIWAIGLIVGWIGATYLMPDLLDMIAEDKASKEIQQQKAILSHDVTKAQMAQYIAEQAQLEAQKRAEAAEETTRLAKVSEYEAQKALKAAEHKLETLTEQLQQHMLERDTLAKQLARSTQHTSPTAEQAKANPKPKTSRTKKPISEKLDHVSQVEAVDDNQLNLLG